MTFRSKTRTYGTGWRGSLTPPNPDLHASPRRASSLNATTTLTNDLLTHTSRTLLTGEERTVRVRPLLFYTLGTKTLRFFPREKTNCICEYATSTFIHNLQSSTYKTFVHSTKMHERRKGERHNPKTISLRPRTTRRTHRVTVHDHHVMGHT